VDESAIIAAVRSSDESTRDDQDQTTRTRPRARALSPNNTDEMSTTVERDGETTNDG